MKRASAAIIFFFMAGVSRGEIGSLPYAVTADNVNLRLRPALKSEIVGSLSRGETAEVVLCDGEWYAVVAPPDTPAWVSEGYLENGEVAASRLNVRTGPGVSYGVISRLPRGEKVTILERAGDWVRIPVPRSVRLWVNARYLNRTPPGGTDKYRGEEKKFPTPSPLRDDYIYPVAPAGPVPTPVPVPRSRKPAAAVSGGAPEDYRAVPHPGKTRSLRGYIRKRDEPLNYGGNAYGFEFRESREEAAPSAFLTTRSIDLDRYRHRKVRIWAVPLHVATGRPTMMEVKGIGFLW